MERAFYELMRTPTMLLLVVPLPGATLKGGEAAVGPKSWLYTLAIRSWTREVALRCKNALVREENRRRTRHDVDREQTRLASREA